MNSQKLISSYFKDLVNNSDNLLKIYNAPNSFYNDNLIFLITDMGIVVMSDNGYEKIFISLDDLKDHINKEHYLAYLFN